MSNYCKKCGENVGYLGKIVEFIYYKIFRIKMFKHKCNNFVVCQNCGNINLRYNSIHMEEDYFLYTRGEPEEKIGLIKKNKIKHKFIKNG